MNRLSSYIFFLLITGLIVFTACKKDRVATSTVYMPNALGVVKVTFEMADTPYTIPVSAVITGAEYATVTNAVAGSDIVVHFRADPEKVAFFNEQNGTDYRVLPEGSYEMPATATIVKGASITAATGLAIHAKGKINPFQDYMIPVSIESIEGANASAYQQTTYYVVNATADLNSMIPYDQAKWTIAGFSTEEPAEGGGNGLAARAIDNDPSTFWNSKWSGGEPGPPHYFIVDMGEEKAVHGIGIMDRYFEGSWQTDGHGQPQDITVSVSTDNATWTEVAVLKDVPHDPGQPWYKYFVSTLKQARYVKFTVTKVYGTSSTNIAEVQVF